MSQADAGSNVGLEAREGAPIDEFDAAYGNEAAYGEDSGSGQWRVFGVDGLGEHRMCCLVEISSIAEIPRLSRQLPKIWGLRQSCILNPTLYCPNPEPRIRNRKPCSSAAVPNPKPQISAVGCFQTLNPISVQSAAAAWSPRLLCTTRWMELEPELRMPFLLDPEGVGSSRGHGLLAWA